MKWHKEEYIKTKLNHPFRVHCTKLTTYFCEQLFYWKLDILNQFFYVYFSVMDRREMEAEDQVNILVSIN